MGDAWSTRRCDRSRIARSRSVWIAERLATVIGVYRKHVSLNVNNCTEQSAHFDHSGLC